jgi:hypothetical protein
MTSRTIQNKISSKQIILYRRVSTPKQARTGYQDQLVTIKRIYPDFSIAQSTIDNITEVKSGCADAERRMASGLGKALKHLKRHPHAIMLVSDADRVARRENVFELIQKQGIGHQIYDATSGLCLNDIVELGLDIAIEQRTEAQRASRINGMVRLIRNGGTIGFDCIRQQSSKGSAHKKRLTKELQAKVLAVVPSLTSRNRGQKPSYEEICGELDERGIRTGQGRFFTPERLAQFRKKNPTKWLRAFDRYHYRRRRIRQVIMTTKREVRKRRQCGRHVHLLLAATKCPLIWASLNLPKCQDLATSHNLTRKPHIMTGSDDGCRGPPDVLGSTCGGY